VPQPALRFLEYVFLALLYLFFLRVIRAVWVELREPRFVATDRGTPRDLSTTSPDVSGPSPQAADGKATAKGHRAAPTRMVVLTPPGGGSFRLADELTIGRAPGCAVPLPADNFVSSVHARVFRQDGDYWVEDLGSTNGTLVNGRKMTGPEPLRRGDRVQVGRTVLELQR